jgi:hypothetical protein
MSAAIQLTTQKEAGGKQGKAFQSRAGLPMKV